MLQVTQVVAKLGLEEGLCCSLDCISFGLGFVRGKKKCKQVARGKNSRAGGGVQGGELFPFSQQHISVLPSVHPWGSPVVLIGGEDEFKLPVEFNH